MAFEIYVLAIVNELYFRRFDADRRARRRPAPPRGEDRAAARLRATSRARRHPFEFFDFGVRRRFSRRLAARGRRDASSARCRSIFKGTSNVLLARDLGLVPIGTMAHEYLQTYQALGVRLRDFQRPRSRTGSRSTAATSASR